MPKTNRNPPLTSWLQSGTFTFEDSTLPYGHLEGSPLPPQGFSQNPFFPGLSTGWMMSFGRCDEETSSLSFDLFAKRNTQARCSTPTKRVNQLLNVVIPKVKASIIAKIAVEGLSSPLENARVMIGRYRSIEITRIFRGKALHTGLL